MKQTSSGDRLFDLATSHAALVQLVEDFRREYEAHLTEHRGQSERRNRIVEIIIAAVVGGLIEYLLHVTVHAA